MSLRFSNFKLSMLAVSALALFPLSASAEDFTPEQKKQIESIIKEYLTSNPEVITKSLEAYQVKQMQAQEEEARKSILENMSSLTASGHPSVGKADAAVTVVEFFDYNCGYCKRALPDIRDIVKSNDNVRFVFIELPILGATSGTAAQYGLAAHKQGKYFEYHSALMEDRGQKDEASLMQIGKDLGLDPEKLKADANSPEVMATLTSNVQLADKVGIHGTPAFIIEGTLFRGFIGKESMEAEIKKAEDAKKAKKAE